MKFKKLAAKISKINADKGFHDNWKNEESQIITKLALIHSEVSEALECVRNGEMTLFSKDGKPEGFPSELADIYIRVIDLASLTNTNLPDAVKVKLQYNASRPFNHGRKVKIEK